MFKTVNSAQKEKHCANNGAVYVVSIDYEEQPVRLRLTDVNDEVPQFQNVPRPFLAMVSEDAPLGTSVYQLMANDQDRDSLVRYSLESGKHKHYIASVLFFCCITVVNSEYSVLSYYY